MNPNPSRDNDFPNMMHHERIRAKTFHYVVGDGEFYASEGFFYDRNFVDHSTGNRVMKCYQCDFCIQFPSRRSSDYITEYRRIMDHRRINYWCRFLIGACDNIPLNSQQYLNDVVLDHLMYEKARDALCSIYLNVPPNTASSPPLLLVKPSMEWISEYRHRVQQQQQEHLNLMARITITPPSPTSDDGASAIPPSAPIIPPDDVASAIPPSAPVLPIESLRHVAIEKFEARNPLMMLEENRLKTFCDVHVIDDERKKEFVVAGFYYTSIREVHNYRDGVEYIKLEVVQCFYCTCKLSAFIKGSVWKHHARNNPKCAYLCSIKTPEYIKVAREIATENLSENDTDNDDVATSTKVLELIDQNTNVDVNCVVCFEPRKTILAYVPCGHICVCCSCIGMLNKCVMCRKPIDSYVRLYLTSNNNKN